MMFQMRIVRRIVTLIDAIKDAGQLPRTCTLPEQPVQAATELRGQDLACVGRTDGRQMRGIKQSRLQEGYFAIELHPGGLESVFGYPECRHPFPLEYALIGHVVHGYDARTIY